MEISINHIQEGEAAIAIVLIFILGFLGVILLVDAVFWRVGVLLFSEPLQIWQFYLVVSTHIGINVRRLVSASVPSCSSPLLKEFSISNSSLVEEAEFGVGF